MDGATADRTRSRCRPVASLGFRETPRWVCHRSPSKPQLLAFLRSEASSEVVQSFSLPPLLLKLWQGVGSARCSAGSASILRLLDRRPSTSDPLYPAPANRRMNL